MKRRSTWTPQREAELRRLWDSTSQRDLSKIFGVTRSAILSKARSMGLVDGHADGRRVWSDDVLQKMNARHVEDLKREHKMPSLHVGTERPVIMRGAPIMSCVGSSAAMCAEG